MKIQLTIKNNLGRLHNGIFTSSNYNSGKIHVMIFVLKKWLVFVTKTLKYYPKHLGSIKDVKFLTWNYTELLHASVIQEYNREVPPYLSVTVIGQAISS